MLHQRSFFVGTTKGIDLINIGHDVRSMIREVNLQSGVVTVAIRTPGAVVAILPNDRKSLAELQEGLAAISAPLRSLLPPTLTIPVEQGKMSFEPWQELFLVDFDASGRRREMVLQLFSPPEEKGKKN